VEFEQNRRLKGEDLLRRFCAGERFPDNEQELQRFVDDLPGLTDDKALTLIAAVFERPVLRAPFREEGALPAFLQAIEDMTRAINTGIWRTRRRRYPPHPMLA
jgi:hypothetical protein